MAPLCWSIFPLKNLVKNACDGTALAVRTYERSQKPLLIKIGKGRTFTWSQHRITCAHVLSELRLAFLIAFHSFFIK